MFESAIGLVLLTSLAAPDAPTVNGPQPTVARESHALASDGTQPRVTEIDLGAFRVSLPLARDNVVLTIDFELYGTVPMFRADALTARLAECKLRLRHAVVMTMRQTSLQELSEADLIALKERMRQASNKVLEAPELTAVGFHRLDYVAE